MEPLPRGLAQESGHRDFPRLEIWIGGLAAREEEIDDRTSGSEQRIDSVGA
jgi:hypothetical protein